MEKESYLRSNIKSRCTGCRACESVCPKKSIKMVFDSEKFMYPKIDKSKCINCGKCIRICPVVNEITLNNKLDHDEIYAYSTTDEKILLSSSSGGAFLDILSVYCRESYVIFGVKFTKDHKAVHDYIMDIKDINKFQKSKYVQSDIGDSYIKAKEFLDKGYKVAFSGTPCQISGLKKFLIKDYDNLLCIDIVCHGVPSQGILDLYLNIVERKYNSKIKQINFREKVFEKGKYNSRNIKIQFENGKEIIENSEKNIYLKGYHKALFYRPSCYECKFASVNRYSDITIADCWGIEKINSYIDHHKGCSMIIVHTAKGKNIINTNKFQNKILLSEKFAIENNSQYSKSIKYNNKRAKFFNNLNENNFEKKIKKLTKNTIIKKTINKLKKILKKIR